MSKYFDIPEGELPKMAFTSQAIAQAVIMRAWRRASEMQDGALMNIQKTLVDEISKALIEAGERK